MGLFILTNSCAPNKGKQLLVTHANIIPAPQQLKISGGNFTLTKTSTLPEWLDDKLMADRNWL